MGKRVFSGVYVCVHMPARTLQFKRRADARACDEYPARGICQFQCVRLSVCVHRESVVVKRQSERGVNRAH